MPSQLSANCLKHVQIMKDMQDMTDMKVGSNFKSFQWKPQSRCPGVQCHPESVKICQDAGSSCTVCRSDKGESENVASWDQLCGFQMVLDQTMTNPVVNSKIMEIYSCSFMFISSSSLKRGNVVIESHDCYSCIGFD